MILKINGESKIPEANLQYESYEAYQKVSIKDIVNKLDGNISSVPQQVKVEEEISETKNTEEIRDLNSENKKS